MKTSKDLELASLELRMAWLMWEYKHAKAQRDELKAELQIEKEVEENEKK